MSVGFTRFKKKKNCPASFNSVFRVVLTTPGGDARTGGGGLEMDAAKLLDKLSPLRGHVAAASAACKPRAGQFPPSVQSHSSII